MELRVDSIILFAHPEACYFPVRYTSNSALHESMPTTVIKSHAMTFMSDTDSSVPATMRPQALERMMRDVCPGDRLLTVNDMLPEITVLVSYKENDTYFWGTLLNDHFVSHCCFRSTFLCVCVCVCMCVCWEMS